MNAGKLKEPVRVLSFAQAAPGVWGWEERETLWAQAEETGKSNLFSRLGLSAPSTEFAVRQCGLSLDNAIRWREEHYFLTAIQGIDRMYLEISAAKVRLTPCRVWRSETHTDPDTKRTIRREPTVVCEFPGVLTEKYLNYRQLEPMGQTEETFVLVTPKPITLESADLVEIGGEKYAVRVCHTLDDSKNEYELYRRENGGKEEAAEHAGG